MDGTCYSVVTIIVSHFGIFDSKNVIQCLQDLVKDDEITERSLTNSLMNKKASCCILWEVKRALINAIKTFCADCYADTTAFIIDKHMTGDMLIDSNIDCTFWIDNSDACNEFWLSFNQLLTMLLYGVIFIYLYTILITIIVFGCSEYIQPSERPITVLKNSFKKWKKPKFLQNISISHLPSLIRDNSVKIVKKNSQPMLKIKKKPIVK